MSIPLIRPQTRWPVAVVIGIAGSLLVGIIMVAFLWPAKTATTQNMPVSVAGPSAAVSALEVAVEKQSPGAIEFVDADGRSAAVDQIKSRDTYGAIILGDAGTLPEVLTAPAGSAVATQLLTGVASQLQAQVTAAGEDPTTALVKVTPVVSLSADDPTGTGLTAAAFPLVLGGSIGGILITFLVVGPARRLAALAGFGVVVGLILAFVMQTWWHYLQGTFVLNAVAMSLAILGVSGFIVGCSSLFGTRGIAIGAVLNLFIANPLSGATTPWQFIVQPWGAIGQYLVPGASNHLLRTLSYFPDASTAQQWLTLSGWVLLGVILTIIGHSRSKAVMSEPAGTRR